MKIGEFFRLAGEQPVLWVTAAMVLAVVWVNGWTDAPNSIAAAVSSGALSGRQGVRLAAFCDGLGACSMVFFPPKVADTVYRMGSFGEDPALAMAALWGVLFSVVAWSGLCWFWGLPTSESHGLIAALTGTALALGSRGGGVQPGPWAKAVWGLVFSLAAGLVLGYLCASLAKRANPSPRFCRLSQVGLAGASAFFHGVQDGQKWAALFLLSCTMALGTPGGPAKVPWWLALVCGGCMGLGTLLGGRRMLRKMGGSLVQLGPSQGLGADVSGAVCLAWASWWGIPVSTTHVKAASLIGAGVSQGKGRVDRQTGRELALAWLLTFPVCLLLGFVWGKLAGQFF